MRYRGRLSVLALVLATSLLPLHAQTRSERLVVGEQKTFRPGYAGGDIAISNPRVCDFRVVSGRLEIMLIANGQGFTMLTVWDQRGVKRDEIGIEVVSPAFAKLLNDLAELVRPYPDVQIRPLGNTAVMTGTVNTPDELAAVRTLAGASGVTSTVTVKKLTPPAGQPQPVDATGAPTPVVQAPPPTPIVQAPPPTPAVQRPPAAPSIVRDPEPPPPVRRAPAVIPGATPVPVEQPPAAVPVPVPVQPEPVAAPPAPVAVPAPAAPPPNVAPAAPAVTVAPTATATPPVTVAPPVTGAPPVAAAPSPTTGDWARPTGTGSVEYLVELYEAPASGPPPEVVGPQGRRLFLGRLRSDPGIEVRHLVKLSGSGTAGAGAERTFSIGLTPTVTAGSIQTAVVVDTDLPLGAADPRKPPVWIRATLTFACRPGQSRFIRETEFTHNAKTTRATTLLVVVTPSLIRAPQPDALAARLAGEQVHASWR
jgi:hypothetical protein